ncbi:MAG: hypothetical protein AMJ75_08950 [Phycisphaerae bacterium SM1_79]|nr:MAG: hypothetical protein AMJ75_08950 [Phycisphaerae bacterium SM1_79]
MAWRRLEIADPNIAQGPGEEPVVAGGAATYPDSRASRQVERIRVCRRPRVILTARQITLFFPGRSAMMFQCNAE